jgi:hypothetical protein
MVMRLKTGVSLMMLILIITDIIIIIIIIIIVIIIPIMIPTDLDEDHAEGDEDGGPVRGDGLAGHLSQPGKARLQSNLSEVSPEQCFPHQRSPRGIVMTGSCLE